MTLTDLRETILKNKKKILILGGILLTVVVVLSLIYPQIRSTISSEQDLPPFDLSSNAGNAGAVDTSLLPAATLPTKANTYKVTGSGAALKEEEVLALAGKLGFSAPPSLATTPEGDVYSFVRGQDSVMITTKPRGFIYSRESTGRAGTTLDESAASAKAKEFLSSIGLSISDLSVLGVQYLSELSTRLSVAGRDQANFVEVSFAWLVDGIPLLGEDPTENATRVIFDRSGIPVFVVFNYLDSSFSEVAEVSLLGLEAVLPQISEKGEVVSLRPQAGVSQWAFPTSLSLVDFAPQEVKLALVQPTDSEFLYPVYLFSGTGSYQEQGVFASLYLLAISEK